MESAQAPTSSGMTLSRLPRRYRLPLLWLRRWRHHLGLGLASVLIGLASVVFYQGSHLSHSLFFTAYQASPWLPLVITPLGLGASVWLMHHAFPNAGGGGIAQALATLAPGSRTLRERLLTLRTALGKMVLALLGISSGATFGYEGPIVQMGAALKYSLTPARIRRNEAAARGLILAGAGAGVAAAFNAPLAGILFAIEEMGRGFGLRASATIVTSVIVASLTAVLLLGDHHYFGDVAAALPLSTGWKALLLCATVGGLLGGLTARTLAYSPALLPRPLSALRAHRPVVFAMLCGLLIAAIGIFSSGATFGTGYWRASDILEGHTAGLEGYGVLKWLTLLLSQLSGAPGGMFAPSLAVGAGLGFNAAQLLPFLPVTPVVLLGMAGFLAGVSRAPLTAAVIVMEVTGSPHLIVPLIACTLLATQISRWVHPPALYEGLARGLLRGARQIDREERRS